MNTNELQQKVLAAARAMPVSSHVPYAFEKRVMARLASESVIDIWSFWGALLWRAAAPCVGLMLVFVVWTAVSNNIANDSLATDLENTVLAPLAQLDENW